VQDLLRRVISVSGQTRTSQTQLGAYCGRSQAHISKVLRGVVPVSKPMAAKLEAWVSEKSEPDKAEVEALIEGIAAAAPERRKHILHILRELSALA